MNFDVEKAKAVLSKLVTRARRGEEVVITKDGKPMARLVPFRQAGSLRGKIKILPGFDEMDKEIEKDFYGEID